MKELRYSPSDIDILYKIITKIEIKKLTLLDVLSFMKIKKLVQQGSIYRPIMGCPSTLKVDKISKN